MRVLNFARHILTHVGSSPCLMDEQFEITVYALIYYYLKALVALYSGQNHGDREEAHKWLLATQKSQQAWQLCWQLMQKEKVGIFLTMLIISCVVQIT